MNKIVLICVSSVLFCIITAFYTVNSYAAWSRFDRITPENVNDQKFKFTFTKIQFTENFQLKLNDTLVNNGQRGEFDFGKSAWLVLTTTPLKNEEQNLARLITDNFSGDNSKILLVSKLGYSDDNVNQNILLAQLHKSQLNNAYIYVGYSPNVSDGGLRYTIDVKSFYKDFLINNPNG